MNIWKLKDKYSTLSAPIKASLWYTICNVLNKGISLFATPIFTRILTEEQFGTFAIFQSWYNIIIIFTSLNIFMGGYQKGLLLYKNDVARFTSSQLSLISIITLSFLVIYILNIDFWTTVLELSPHLMVAMFIELLTMPALSFWSAKERFDFKYKKYVLISVLMNIFSLVLGVLAVLNTSHKIEARVFSDVFAKAIFAGPLFVFLMMKGKVFFDQKYWKYALRFNLPLIPHYLSNYVLGQSDRLMIGRMVGNSQAAYYSVTYTISTMMMLIVTAINNSLTPYIYKEINTAEMNRQSNEDVVKKVRMITTPLFLLIALLCVVIMAFAPEVILIFAGENYTEATYVIPPIAVSVFFIYLYSMFSTIEYYYQKTAQIAVATTISAVLNLFLNYVFINLYGYYAAGYTTLICYVCLSVMHYIFYKKILKKKMNNIDDIYNIKAVLMISGSILIVMFIMIFTYKYTFVRYGIISIVAVLVIWKKNYLINLVGMFKNK